MAESRSALAPLNLNVPLSRLSLGGRKAAATNKRTSHSRQSFAPVPPQSSTSRRSSVYSATSRLSSLHGVGGSGSGIRTDPRPTSDRAFQKECIAKILLYCQSRDNRQFTAKSLLSPSSKDFRALCVFLFRALDPRFELSATVEDDIKKVMKWLGYPFAISKHSLQAAGTPHTWPTLLAMLAWTVELLLYMEKVDAETDANADGDGDGSKPEQLFYAFVTQSYESFLGGTDNAKIDEQLANTFTVRHTALAAEHARLESELAALEAECQSLDDAQSQIPVLESKRQTYSDDCAKFRALLAELHAHSEAVDKKLHEKSSESTATQCRREALLEQRSTLSAKIASQSLSALQVSALVHQHSMLASALTDLESKKSRIASERFSAEAAEQKLINDMHELVAEFNQRQATVEQCALHLTLSKDSETGALTVQPPLKDVKAQLASIEAGVQRQLAELTSSLRLLDEETRAASEAATESSRAVSELTSALARREDQYVAQRSAMNSELSALVSEVETLETQLAQRAQAASDAERERSEKSLTELTEEKARWLRELSAERTRAQTESWTLVESLVAHHTEIKRTITHLNATASSILAQVNSEPISA